jgi:hypothetical protein
LPLWGLRSTMWVVRLQVLAGAEQAR